MSFVWPNPFAKGMEYLVLRLELFKGTAMGVSKHKAENKHHQSLFAHLQSIKTLDHPVASHENATLGLKIERKLAMKSMKVEKGRT